MNKLAKSQMIEIIYNKISLNNNIFSPNDDWTWNQVLLIGDVLKWRKATISVSIEEYIEDSLSELTIEKWIDGGDHEEIRDLNYCKESILSHWLIKLLTIWGDYTKSIQEQSTECIEYIYNLITK